MQRMDAAKAQSQLSKLMNAAQEEPVILEQQDGPAALLVSVSDFEELQAFKNGKLRALIDEGYDDLDKGRIVDGEEAFDRVLRSLEIGVTKTR